MSDAIHQKPSPGWGWLMIAVGIVVAAMGAGVIPKDAGSRHAPAWIGILCGAIFALGGIMILIGEKSRATTFLAAVLFACFGVVGGWVSLFGAAEGFSSSLPFLPQRAIVLMARGMFGIGALVCFAAALAVWRQFVRRE
jgi:hypothetical protein